MEKKEPTTAEIAAEPDRKMAFVAKITNIEPIKDADRLELATVLGWKVIVKKNEFKVGDLCIYYTLMSLLDDTNPEFNFLKDKNGKLAPLRSKKMKGALSQGLITSIAAVKYYGKDPGTLQEGDDVSVLMKVKKYVPKEESHAYVPPPGEKKPMLPFPSYLPKTDEERIQNIPHILDVLKDQQVVVTRKEDGTSATYIFMNGEFLICSRNFVRSEPESKDPKKPDLYIETEKKFNIAAAMKEYGKNLGIQGEIVGPTINKNRLGLKEIDFRVFNIYLIDLKRYAKFEECEEICTKLGLHRVPLLYKGVFKEEWNTVDKLMAYVETLEYYKGMPAEGIVVKSNRPEPERRISFKVVSNKYLLKHGEQPPYYQWLILCKIDYQIIPVIACIKMQQPFECTHKTIIRTTFKYEGSRRGTDSRYLLNYNIVVFEKAVKQLEDNKQYLQAFTYAEQLIVQYCQKGAAAEAVVPYVSSAVYRANKNSMELLQQGKQKAALRLLRHAERLLGSFKCKELAFLMNLTYNNLACVYKRRGKPLSALKCLEKGTEVCLAFNEKDNIAITHLNICAILSQLGNHKAASEEAYKASIQCNQDLEKLRTAIKENRGPVLKLRKEYHEKMSLLGISYYNLGVQEEFIGNYRHALEWYQKACNVVEGNPEIDLKLKSSFYTALRQASDKLCNASGRKRRLPSAQGRRENFPVKNSATIATSRSRPISAKPRNMTSTIQKAPIQTVRLKNVLISQSTKKQTAVHSPRDKKKIKLVKRSSRGTTPTIIQSAANSINYGAPKRYCKLGHNTMSMNYPSMKIEDHTRTPTLTCLSSEFAHGKNRSQSSFSGTTIKESFREKVPAGILKKSTTDCLLEEADRLLEAECSKRAQKENPAPVVVQVQKEDSVEEQQILKTLGMLNWSDEEEAEFENEKENNEPEEVQVIQDFPEETFEEQDKEKEVDAIGVLIGNEKPKDQEEFEYSDESVNENIVESPKSIPQISALNPASSPIPLGPSETVITLPSFTKISIKKPAPTKSPSEAAVSIQKMYRGYLAKKHHKRLLQYKNKSYKLVFRGYYKPTDYITTPATVLLQYSAKESKIRVVLTVLKSHSILYSIELAIPTAGNKPIPIIVLRKAWEKVLVEKSGSISKDSLQFYEAVKKMIEENVDTEKPEFSFYKDESSEDKIEEKKVQEDELNESEKEKSVIIPSSEPELLVNEMNSEEEIVEDALDHVENEIKEEEFVDEEPAKAENVEKDNELEPPKEKCEDKKKEEECEGIIVEKPIKEQDKPESPYNEHPQAEPKSEEEIEEEEVKNEEYEESYDNSAKLKPNKLPQPDIKEHHEERNSFTSPKLLQIQHERDVEGKAEIEGHEMPVEEPQLLQKPHSEEKSPVDDALIADRDELAKSIKKKVEKVEDVKEEEEANNNEEEYKENEVEEVVESIEKEERPETPQDPPRIDINDEVPARNSTETKEVLKEEECEVKETEVKEEETPDLKKPNSQTSFKEKVDEIQEKSKEAIVEGADVQCTNEPEDSSIKNEGKVEPATDTKQVEEVKDVQPQQQNTETLTAHCEQQKEDELELIEKQQDKSETYSLHESTEVAHIEIPQPKVEIGEQIIDPPVKIASPAEPLETSQVKDAPLPEPITNVTESIHKITRSINKQPFELNFVKTPDGSVELSAKNTITNASNSLALQPNIASYLLSHQAIQAKIHLMCNLIGNALVLTENDKFGFDQSKLAIASNKVLDEAKEKKVIAIQCAYRRYKAIKACIGFRRKKNQGAEILLQQGIKLGGQYQIIRILINVADRNTLMIKSSKAKSHMTLRLTNIIKQSLWEVLKNDSNELRKILRINLVKIVAYDPKTKTIMFPPKEVKKRQLTFSYFVIQALFSLYLLHYVYVLSAPSHFHIEMSQHFIFRSFPFFDAYYPRAFLQFLAYFCDFPHQFFRKAQGRSVNYISITPIHLSNVPFNNFKQCNFSSCLLYARLFGQSAILCNCFFRALAKSMQVFHSTYFCKGRLAQGSGYQGLARSTAKVPENSAFGLIQDWQKVQKVYFPVRILRGYKAFLGSFFVTYRASFYSRKCF
eukprot:TRINITY_DN9_c0_g2_i1.p1 TRINITY_DN9_c0_g2~~TRINITY_DN9_c0_g2_i1.p1  ORF type:complete len:2097 (-),score=250.12 TRINITY_DN9_c0_g2_i1:27072-33257(-)